MKHELWYSVVVRDRHGKIVSRERRKSRSFLKQWNQVVYCQMAMVPLAAAVVDINGVNRTATYSTLTLRVVAAAGTTDFGIRVGTGDTAVAIDNHALETPIEEGGGVEHLVCAVADFVVSAPNCSFVISRTITNNSGASITVKEAGIYARMGDSYYFCGIREVLTVPQAVPDGGSITLDWTLQVTA